MKTVNGNAMMALVEVKFTAAVGKDNEVNEHINIDKLINTQ